MLASRYLVSQRGANVACRAVQRAHFHSSIPSFVKVGDALPDLDVLAEGSPGNKVNLAKELKGKGLIIGVPAAFSESNIVHVYAWIVNGCRMLMKAPEPDILEFSVMRLI